MAVTYEDTYKGYPILTDKGRKLGCDTKILEKNERLIDHMTGKHARTLVFRMDLNYPKDYGAPKDNAHVREFMSKFIKHWKYNGLDPHYIFVREQSKEKAQHYHCGVMIDGSKKRHPQDLLEKAEDHWGKTIGVPSGKGYVDHCTRSRDGKPQTNCYMLDRNSEAFETKKDDCFERLSYLAKINTKGYAPPRIREMSASRLPKQNP